MQQFDLGLNLSTKKTRKREFLEQMQQVVPWQELVDLIASYAPEGRKGRPPFPVERPFTQNSVHPLHSVVVDAIRHVSSLVAPTAFGVDSVVLVSVAFRLPVALLV